MAYIKITTNARKTVAQLESYRTRKSAEVGAVVAASGERIKDQARLNINDFTGELADSLNSIYSYGAGVHNAVIGSDLERAFYLEFGTGPSSAKGPRPKYMPPPGALEPWMRFRGIDVPEAVMRLHIYNHGTKPHPFLTPAFEKETAQFLAELAAVLRKG